MKLNKNTKLTILISVLFIVIILLIILKLNNTNNPTSNNPNNSVSSSTTNKNTASSKEETIPTSNHIGETNSNGDTVYYESDLDQDFNGSSPISVPTQSQQPETGAEDAGDISLDFPLERYLPYQGRYFRIEKYYDVNNLEVLVSDKSKTDLAKEEVKQWLIDQGDDQYDKFTIVYQ
jgi:hypothetical protein